MTLFYIIVSVLGGSGATVAIINQFGKIKVKQLDVFVGERQQFIREVNELRDTMNTLYNQHYKLLQENENFKRKIQDLEDHVNKKSILLNELKVYRSKHEKLIELVKEYKNDNEHSDYFIKNVISLSKENVPGN